MIQRSRGAEAEYRPASRRPERRDSSLSGLLRPSEGFLQAVLSRLHLAPGTLGLGVAVVTLLLHTRWPSPLWALPAMIGLVNGTEGLLREREALVSSLNGHQRVWRPESWLAPLLLVIIAAGIVPLFKLEGIALTLTVLAIIGLMVISIAADYVILSGQSRWTDIAHVVSSLVVYVTAFGLYFAFLSSNLQELSISSIGVGLTTGLLASVLIRQTGAPWSRTLLYAGVIVVAIVEVRWALDFLDFSGPMMAVFLLLVFYLITGVVQNHLRGQMTRGLVAEFATVGATGFLLLYALRFWTG